MQFLSRLNMITLIEILTIGLPFCAFKLITGFVFNFYSLLFLGLIDVLINLVNLISLISLNKRVLPACTFSTLIYLFQRKRFKQHHAWIDLGNALDVLFSFIIVATVVGGGFLKEFTPIEIQIWNTAVVLNVLGAGFSRVRESVKNFTS